MPTSAYTTVTFVWFIQTARPCRGLHENCLQRVITCSGLILEIAGLAFLVYVLTRHGQTRHGACPFVESANACPVKCGAAGKLIKHWIFENSRLGDNVRGHVSRKYRLGAHSNPRCKMQDQRFAQPHVSCPQVNEHIISNLLKITLH